MFSKCVGVRFSTSSGFKLFRAPCNRGKLFERGKGFALRFDLSIWLSVAGSIGGLLSPPQQGADEINERVSDALTRH